MTTARQVKRWLKAQGIEAKYAKSITAIRRGERVVSYIQIRGGGLGEIFPSEIRERMLKLTYPAAEWLKPPWSAGNVRPHMVSMPPHTWALLMAEVVE